MRNFEYVGPREHAPEDAVPSGRAIHSLDELMGFVEERIEELDEPFTFVVDLYGTLLLAPRRSEHVRAAGGLPVLAAGENAFDESGRVTYASNQSIGYRPDESSWRAVAEALHRIGVKVPDGFDDVFVFRSCPQCGQVNIIEDDWYVCANCGGSSRDDTVSGSRSGVRTSRSRSAASHTGPDLRKARREGVEPPTF